jgi:hypothetical protein
MSRVTINNINPPQEKFYSRGDLFIIYKDGEYQYTVMLTNVKGEMVLTMLDDGDFWCYPRVIKNQFRVTKAELREMIGESYIFVKINNPQIVINES